MATASHDTLKCLVLGVFITFPSNKNRFRSFKSKENIHKKEENPYHVDPVNILELKNENSQSGYSDLRRGLIEIDGCV